MRILSPRHSREGGNLKILALAARMTLCGLIFTGTLLAKPVSLLKRPDLYPAAEEPYQNILADELVNTEPPAMEKGTKPEVKLEKALTAVSTGKITRPQIEHIAATCQGKIDALWKDRTHISRDKLPNFQRSMGHAQKICKQFEELDRSLKRADQAIQTFDQSMQLAQSQY